MIPVYVKPMVSFITVSCDPIFLTDILTDIQTLKTETSGCDLFTIQ